MNKEILFEIAKIIDNEFRPARETFTSVRKDGYYFLNTNVCDWASMIRVYTEGDKITKITRCGEDTDGYQPIQAATMDRVNKYLQSIDNPIPPNQNN